MHYYIGWWEIDTWDDLCLGSREGGFERGEVRSEGLADGAAREKRCHRKVMATLRSSVGTAQAEPDGGHTASRERLETRAIRP